MDFRLILFLFSISLFSSCSSFQHEHADANPEDKVEVKGEPFLEYMELRMGNAEDFSYEAMHNAFKEASQPLTKRSTPQGFDAPWQIEGPTNLGGRVSALAIDASNDEKWYLGFPNGGVWRTENAGQSYTPISEDFAFTSIGALAFDTAKSRLWVGTGDPSVPGYWFIGDGLHYSDDEGVTWNQGGLSDMGIINEIAINKRSPDTIFVATMGKPYAPDTNRGLYRSDDGGQTWDNVLFIADTVGVSDVRLDPLNPSTVYATTWPRLRTYTGSIVRGNETLLLKSTDGGETWENLQPLVGYELPACRLGFDLSPSDPNRLYLSVTGNDLSFTSFHRSDDAGATWTQVQTDTVLVDGFSEEPFAGFGWYFGKTRVDPQDKDHVFMLGVDLYESFDGGDTWIFGDDFFVHADKHELAWRNNGEALLGTDGGLYRRPDGVTDWDNAEDIPTNMFYRVATVPSDPESFAGGLQDNGTALGGIDGGGLEWLDLFGGDGFQPVFDVNDEETYIAETQRGRIWYFDGGSISEVTPLPTSEPRSWDMPIASRYDTVSGETYLLTGGNRPYLSTYLNIVDFWDIVDIQVTGPTVGRPPVITAAHIAKDLTYYLGTSDGKLWKGNQGGDWQELSVPTTGRYITDVTSSEDNPNVLLLTVTQYRNGDSTPFIWRSIDAGDTWVSLAGDLPQLAINSALILPQTDDSLIVVGTDAGVYASDDAGQTYTRLGSGMTNVVVMDLTFEFSTKTLVAGTFGRSVQTIDLSGTTFYTSQPSSTNDQERSAYGSEIQISPNPASESILLEAKLLEPGRDGKAILVDAAGRTVHSWVVPSSGGQVRQALTLPAHLMNGTYTLSYRIKSTVKSKKVQIRR